MPVSYWKKIQLNKAICISLLAVKRRVSNGKRTEQGTIQGVTGRVISRKADLKL